MSQIKVSKLLAVAVLAFSGSAFAQASATKDVSVDVTLGSKCLFTNSTALTLTTTYPAFSTIAVDSTTGNAAVQCTRGGPTPTLSFGAAGQDIGVVGGLVFQLSSAYTPGIAGVAPAGLAISDLGSARTGSFAVKATFPADQAGTTGATTPVTRTMTVTF
jgi:hypothetical protein